MSHTGKSNARAAKGGAQAGAKKTGRGARVPGYKGHNAGSRKAQVHECYDTEGADAAVKLAVSLGLKEVTAWIWVKAWARAAGAPIPGKN